MTNEEWYDTEIAPKLLELCNACGDRGMSFIATVEYEPSEMSTTKRLVNPGLAMVMLAHCAHSGANIDGYVIGLVRYLREHKISWDSSIVMRQFGGTSHQPKAANENP